LTAAVIRSDAFFIPADPGQRFALFHSANGPVERGSILYVHPFAEEMNKARRMAALQARAFAREGFSVLQVDLYGCGDSSGDFADARWEIWRDDLALAADWLAEHAARPVHLWGLRLGATLAIEARREAADRYASAVLWQPVTNGEAHMNQFLRLALAGDMIRAAENAPPSGSLRKRLAEGHTVEVAGYRIAPELVRAIDQRRLDPGFAPPGTVHWLDVKRGSGDIPAAARRTLEAWRGAGLPATYAGIEGDPFWSSFDIIEVPELVSATTALYAAEAK
jgi:exosortase A-associated hydrolase 2